MDKIDVNNQESTSQLWSTLQETAFQRTVRVHLAAMGTVLITQILLGILHRNSAIVLFGLGLVAVWMAIETTERLIILTGLPLSALTIATALEVSRYPEAPWIILSLTSGLAAWDTYHLIHRSSGIDHIERSKELEDIHLRRLLLVVSVGSVLGLVVMLAEINLGFGLTLVLGLLAIVGIGQIVRFLRKNNT
jgi:hypothetical protein